MIYKSEIKEVLSNNNISFCDKYGKVIIRDEVKSVTVENFIDGIFALLQDLKSTNNSRTNFNKMVISTDGADITAICYINNEIYTYRIRDGLIADKNVSELN